jgi:hypothetical protein
MPVLLSLAYIIVSGDTAHERQLPYLGERRRVDLVLGSELEANGRVGLGVPGSAGTSLDGGVHLLVVGGAEDAEGVGGSDGGVVDGGRVSDSSGVLGDGGLLHIISDFTTNKEALVAETASATALTAPLAWRSAKTRPWKLFCLKWKLAFWPLLPALGLKLERNSVFKPEVMVSFSSTLVARRLAVFQDWVMLMPARRCVSRFNTKPTFAPGP